MKKVKKHHLIAFSKYLIYPLGGAEKSMYAILEKADSEGRPIDVISFKAKNFIGRDLHEKIFPDRWNIIYLSGFFNFSRFFYVEYFLNKFRLVQRLRKLLIDFEDGRLITYGFYAPAAIVVSKLPVTVYLRSETDLGLNPNYFGWSLKGVFKFFYKVVEFPFYLLYLRDLRRLYRCADQIIANSKFMANELKFRFNRRAEVQYPEIRIDNLRLSFQAAKMTVAKLEKGIVFVGDDQRKGLFIILNLAKRLAQRRFFVFSRQVKKDYVQGNIHWMRWRVDPVQMYILADCVLVPSQCRETYGRVSREAFLLGIPVLVSNVGGLPETVDNVEHFIVKNYTSVSDWENKINTLQHSISER